MQRATGPKEQYRHLLVDFILVALLLVNLLLIIFDWLFAADAIRDLLEGAMPVFTKWYGNVVHPNFILIDLAFVAVFLTDFIVSWIGAMVKGLYHRWFFYPFIHWYDLLGCIPLAGFRFLRLLRVISILYRLHRTGILNLADTLPGRTISKYYEVLLEEVSDRVIIKMLSDAQEEVSHGGPLLDSIISDVLEPGAVVPLVGGVVGGVPVDHVAVLGQERVVVRTAPAGHRQPGDDLLFDVEPGARIVEPWIEHQVPPCP